MEFVGWGVLLFVVFVFVSWCVIGCLECAMEGCALLLVRWWLLYGVCCLLICALLVACCPGVCHVPNVVS